MVEIIKGTYVEVPFTLVDANGTAVDMSTSGRSLVLRMRKIGDSAVTITRTTGVSGEYSWTSQSGGTGAFLFSTTSTAAATEGEYEVNVAYIATAESKIHIVLPTTKWRIVANGTGTL
jgi:hypothetical protein